MPFFLPESYSLVKLMYALILFVHNASWKIITSLFCSNYIKIIRQVLKNPTTSLSMSFKIYCHMHATIDKCILSLKQSLPKSISSHLIIFFFVCTDRFGCPPWNGWRYFSSHKFCMPFLGSNIYKHFKCLPWWAVNKIIWSKILSSCFNIFIFFFM